MDTKVYNYPNSRRVAICLFAIVLILISIYLIIKLAKLSSGYNNVLLENATFIIITCTIAIYLIFYSNTPYVKLEKDLLFVRNFIVYDKIDLKNTSVVIDNYNIDFFKNRYKISFINLNLLSEKDRDDIVKQLSPYK